MHVTFPGPVGTLEGLLDAVESPRAAVIFAHPLPSHGGTMHTKAVFQGAKGLSRIGCAVLRFNFRGVGSSAARTSSISPGPSSNSPALDFMHARYPDVPMWAAGFSFGSWVALETGAADPRVTVLIGIAPPVTREHYSFEATLETTKPKFLVHGDLDQIVPLNDLWAFYARLKEPKELAVIAGANHLFEGHTRDVGDALEDLLGDFDE